MGRSNNRKVQNVTEKLVNELCVRQGPENARYSESKMHTQNLRESSGVKVKRTKAGPQ